jgi:hypothetical protein
MISDLRRHLKRQYAEEIALREQQVASGAINSLEEYKRLCGEIRGLAIARDITFAALEKVEEDDDE